MGEEERYHIMRKQIEAFREKVQICQSSYSAQLAESMLTNITDKDGKHIDTVYKIRQYVKSRPAAQSKQNQTDVYAVWYLNNLQYLKELKTNFDERIYLPLTKIYLTQQTEEPGIMGTDTGTQLSLKSGDTNTMIRAPSAASVLKFKDDLPEVKDLYDYTEIENVSTRLNYLRQRWQHLLEDEGEITSTLFSYNSVPQMTPRCPKQMANLLRLVPDILLKCGNAAILATQWLQSASSKAIDPHTKHEKLERVKSVLTERLTGLSNEIKTGERELEHESNDLEMLTEREERANEIMSKTHEIDMRLQRIQAEINQLGIECGELQRRHAAATDVAIEQEIKQEKQRLELRIHKLRQQIDLHLYERDLLNQDLTLELEVKPCLIRFTDHIQEKCESLEQTIDEKRSEKHRVESALIPVIADTKRTQAEISRTNSVNSTPQHTTLDVGGSEAMRPEDGWIYYNH